MASHPQGFHYKTMNLEDIKNMKIGKIAHKDSVLFLWATVPMILEAFEVLSAWGYKYKTMLFWRKPGRGGLGFWFRGQIEIIILGVKGNVKAFHTNISNVTEAPRRKHSQKPNEFYEILESLKIKPRIELFARQKRKGWDVWGNEVRSNIKL